MKKFGTWFRCGVCNYKIWIREMPNVVMTFSIILATFWIRLGIAYVVHL